MRALPWADPRTRFCAWLIALAISSSVFSLPTLVSAAALGTQAAHPGVGAQDDGTWQDLIVPAQSNHNAIYDPVRDRMLVLGGLDGSYVERNDVWVLSLSGAPIWTQLAPGGVPPSPRGGESTVYDPVHDRIIVFGGRNGTPVYFNEVWALSLSVTPTWTLLAPAGSAPSGRYQHGAIYDPVRDRMIVFGGDDEAGGFLDDVWALELSGTPTWMQMAPVGEPPTPRIAQSAIYDVTNDRMVIFGGGVPQRQNDVWALSLDAQPTWTRQAPTGSPPPPRSGPSAIYDPFANRMVIFGGYDGDFSSDTWALSLSGTPAWAQLAPAGGPPGPRAYHSAVYDAKRGRMLVYGGWGGSVTGRTSDTWELTLAGSPTWTELPLDVATPNWRWEHTAVLDPVRSRMIILGGAGRPLDAWALGLAGTPAWTQLAPTGGPAGSRRGHAAIYDPVRDRVVVFGGDDGALLDDVWLLPLSGAPTWTTMVGTPPSARRDHTAIYDPVRDRMIVFGGFDGVHRNDAWALSFSETPGWTQLAPTGVPPAPREDHTAIYDPAGDRVVVFGGTAGTPPNEYRLDDVWALSLAGTPAWTQLAPSGIPPSPRWGHTATYDPARHRMIVFGGHGDTTLDDVWALDLGGAPDWHQLAPAGLHPLPRREQVAVYDPEGDRMFVHGGYRFYSFADTWALDFGGTPVARDHDPAPGFAFAPPHPNPSPGPMSFDFTVPRQIHVSIAVLDLSGREIARVADGDFAPGRHTGTWDGTGRMRVPAPSGIYFVRWRTPGRTLTRRVALIR